MEMLERYPIYDLTMIRNVATQYGLLQILIDAVVSLLVVKIWYLHS
jgi:hypothetical protein